MSKQSTNSLFSMTDFREYIRMWAQANGRGAYRRIATALGMHTTLVSQIINDRKCFTEEQAAALCSHMGLNQLETDYFLKLIQIERAGNPQLRAIHSRQLQQLRKQANEIKGRVPESQELTEQDRVIFYSSWQYSLVRLLTSIDRYQKANDIAQHLGISVSRLQEILDFLSTRGLCRIAGSKYIRTEKNTHIESGSALAIRHHQNWRAKSFALLEQMDSEDLAFTAPISISKKDIQKVRSVLLETIANIAKIVEDSPPEEVVYFGIDWLKI
jgi:uncharacterized protein (TIGR02147 family)